LALKREYALFSAVTLAVASAVGAIVIADGIQTSPCYGCPPNVYESYQPCILGYSGFQVVRQYPNPSTWTFTLREGSTGYLFYEYNVTKGLNYFLKGLNGTWTIWQTYNNGSSLLAEILGSKVTLVHFNPPNGFPITRPNETYQPGALLSVRNYDVRGNLVNVTWSLRSLSLGTFPVEASDLGWHTFVVVSPSEAVNATSETFTRTCGTGGAVNVNGVP
jgi:hypothetical protein